MSWETAYRLKLCWQMISQAAYQLELLEYSISGDLHEWDLLVGATTLRDRPLIGIARTIGFGSDLPIGINCHDYRV